MWASRTGIQLPSTCLSLSNRQDCRFTEPVIVLDLSPAACEARLKAVERALKMIEAPERSWMPNSNRAAFILRTAIHPKLGGKK
jgi:hypothetical protein